MRHLPTSLRQIPAKNFPLASEKCFQTHCLGLPAISFSLGRKYSSATAPEDSNLSTGLGLRKRSGIRFTVFASPEHGPGTEARREFHEPMFNTRCNKKAVAGRKSVSLPGNDQIPVTVVDEVELVLIVRGLRVNRHRSIDLDRHRAVSQSSDKALPHRPLVGDLPGKLSQKLACGGFHRLDYAAMCAQPAGL